jgi:hypothetical protein
VGLQLHGGTSLPDPLGYLLRSSAALVHKRWVKEGLHRQALWAG